MTATKPIIRTSERKDLARCWQRWYWAYVDKLVPLTTAPALQFGDLIHQCLAAYYIPGRKRGPDPAETFVALWEQFGEKLHGVYDDEGAFLNAFDLGIEMCLNYVKYAKEADKDYEIIAPEQPFKVVQPTFIYVGVADAVVRNIRTKKIGMFEHKTTKSIPPDYWLPMDEQAGAYWTFLPAWLKKEGILEKKDDVDYVLFNFLNKKMSDTRPKNNLGQALNNNGTVSKRQPPQLFYREMVMRNPDARNAMIYRVEAQAWLMDGMRHKRIPVVKSIQSSCRYDCQFKDLCELHENNADWEEYRDAMFTTGDPYAQHAAVLTERER